MRRGSKKILAFRKFSHFTLDVFTDQSPATVQIDGSFPLPFTPSSIMQKVNMVLSNNQQLLEISAFPMEIKTT